MVIEVKPLQPEKHATPKEVTDEGMVIEVKPLQSSKQISPNEVTTYSTLLSPLIFSGIMISPEYFSFVLGKSIAVFVPESNLKLRPSITSAIALLVVIIIMTTITTKLLKELCANRLSPTRPVLNVKTFIS